MNSVVRQDEINNKSVPAHPSSGSDKKTLSGNLGTLDIVFTVLAYNAPLTVVTGFIPLIVSLGNGAGVPVTFLLAGALMLLFSVGFTTMARHVPNAGAFYAYISAGLGRPAGLGSAFMALLAYFFMLLGITLYAGVVFVSLTKQFFGSSLLQWWQWSFLLAAVVAALGYLRITFSARILMLALVGEIILVAAWELSVGSSQSGAHLRTSWLTPSAITSGSIGLAILFGMSSFAGFEATAIFREECKDPDKSVPRATYLAVVIMTLTFSSAAYFFITSYGVDAALAKATADPSNATLDSIGQYLGTIGLDAVNLLLGSSVFACMLALHNILSRYLYCLSVDGTLPRVFGSVHPRHGSPHKASLMVTFIAATALALLAYEGVEPYSGYGALVGVGGYALMILQILTSLAVIVFFQRKKLQVSRLKSFVAPLVSFVALMITACLASVNLDLLTGNATVAMILLAVIFGSLLLGILYALYLKKSKGRVYQSIGRQQV
ncbi:APC family permease [Pseudomonas sp. A-R-19]|uniref:APC family permease n=1 Tax=Pseudomonas sp. A-R-19 TaxID=2832403 RepID=UPI001CBE827E|nr:APC family permease [Pseudomonas sp. A-R-19]